MTPLDIGAPLKFAMWRPGQEETFYRIINSGRRVDVAALPVGVGKSLIAWLVANLLGARTVILTPTKGLQDQYLRDFKAMGLTDVRGMGNYPCRMLHSGGGGNQPQCDVGPCLDGEQCVWKERGCDYFDAVKTAREAQIVITNPDFWFTHGTEETLGPRDLLVVDEAHSLGGIVTEAAGVEFGKWEVALRGEMGTWGMGEWREWGKVEAARVAASLQSGNLSMRARREARDLLKRLVRLIYSGPDWVVEYIPKKLMRAEPVLPAPYVEPMLFRGIPKILLMSATIRPPHLADLGVAAADYHFFEAPSPFEPSRRPIYWIPTGIRMSHKSSEEDMRRLVGMMDDFIEPRLDRKGIIHAVSYDRAREIKRLSRHRAFMLLDQQDTPTSQIVRTFETGAAPSILISPSIHTGWDFPYDAAEWQAIPKIPFPDTRGGLAQARAEADPTWGTRFAITTLQQMVGRVMRAEDDAGETAIFDDNIKWLYPHYRPHYSMWFRQAFKMVERAPAPPPKIRP